MLVRIVGPAGPNLTADIIFDIALCAILIYGLTAGIKKDYKFDNTYNC